MSVFDFLDNVNKIELDLHPWMKEKNFVLATNDNVASIIDECIESGLYALDLETTGLNNNVFNGETVDKIVGACISADGETGYYIPLRHKTNREANVSWSLFKKEMLRLINSEAVAIFHNGKFDQEFLQFCGGEPLGLWDKSKAWHDTMIICYLLDPRTKNKGLKGLSLKELGMEMFELPDLFPKDNKGGRRDLDFSELDPCDRNTLYYAGADAICTFLLFKTLYPRLTEAEAPQKFIYQLEKDVITATRWMERTRIMISEEKVVELIRLGQKEWLESISALYEGANELLERDVRPGYVKLLQGVSVESPRRPVNPRIDFRFDPNDTSVSLKKKIALARGESDSCALDPLMKVDKKTIIKTITKRVNSLTQRGVKEDKDFPLVYDLNSPEQLGLMLHELGVKGLQTTEKSGQIKTSKGDIEAVLEKGKKDFPFLAKIKNFREVSKALGTYLMALYNDRHEDSTVTANFNSTRADTGRFTAPASKDPSKDGRTSYPFQGTPAQYKKDIPECLKRIRECIVAREGKVMAAIDYAGVELRIVTNMSHESLWLREYFRCSSCDHTFDRGDGESTPEAPPSLCPDCGSDKIGDLHTLTSLAIFGDVEGKRKDKRQIAKSVNFALCYGGSGRAVQSSTGVDENEGARIKSQFDATYKTLKVWWDEQRKFARRTGYVLTPFGRRYPVPDILLPKRDSETGRSNGAFIAKAERNAVNGPIQGASADITKIAMALIYKRVKAKGWFGKLNLLITMHDELVFEIDKDILQEALDMISEVMVRNNAILKLKWNVPLVVDVELGFDWTAPWNVVDFKYGLKEPPPEIKPYLKYDHLKIDKPEETSKPAENNNVERVDFNIDQEFTFKYANELAEGILGSIDPQGAPLTLTIKGVDCTNLLLDVLRRNGHSLPQGIKVNAEKLKVLSNESRLSQSM